MNFDLYFVVIFGAIVLTAFSPIAYQYLGLIISRIRIGKIGNDNRDTGSNHNR